MGRKEKPPGLLSDRANTICLLLILREDSDENHALPMRELIRLMSARYGLTVDRRTVYSSLGLLQDLGFDISTYEDNGKGYYLRQRDFDPTEVRLLMDAVYSLRGISAKQTKELIEKLGGLLSLHQRKTYRHLTVINPQRKTSNNHVFYNIGLLDEAIADKVKVRFSYLQYDSNKTLKPGKKDLYTINPYGMVFTNENYYLIGNNDKYEDLSHYRIDRISGVEFTEEKVKVPPQGFNIKEYTEKTVYMFGGAEEKIALRCHIDILDHVIEKFGTGINIYNVSEERFDATFIGFPKGVKFFAQQYLPYCEILEPGWLRAELAENLEKAMKMYRL